MNNPKIDLDKAQKVFSVFTQHTIQPEVLRGWIGAMKNVIINSAVNMPSARENVAEVEMLKEDMSETKAAADFLTDLEVVLAE